MNYIIDNTNVDYRLLDTVEIHFASGGRIIIKELPDFPPFDCTQEDGCYEMATHLVLMFTADEKEDMMCTLCDKHLSDLRKLKELEVPMIVYH